MTEKFYVPNKQWKKLSDDEKEQKLAKAKKAGVELIITKHTTGRERLVGIAKKLNKKNVNEGMKKYQEFWVKYDKVMDQVFGSEKDKSKLIWGDKKKKVSIF